MGLAISFGSLSRGHAPELDLISIANLSYSKFKPRTPGFLRPERSSISSRGRSNSYASRGHSERKPYLSGNFTMLKRTH